MGERMKEYGDKPRYERGRGRGRRGRGGRGGRGRGRGGRRYDDDDEEGYNNNRNRSYSDEEFDRYEERPRRGRGGRGRGGRRRGRGGHREPRPVVTESDVIFVGNLNYKADVDDLWDHFEQCGEVNEVRISKYPDGRKKGFAHVEFKEKDSALKALKMNGDEFMGREMRIDLAAPSKAGKQ